MKWDKYNLILVWKMNSVSEALRQGGTDFYKGLYYASMIHTRGEKKHWDWPKKIIWRKQNQKIAQGKQKQF